MRGLKDRIVIVTGGSGGLGEAMVQRLTEEGCRVAVYDVTEPNAELVQVCGAALKFYRTDITDEASVQHSAQAVQRDLGNATVLVNDAAIFIFRSIDATTEEWEKILRVNVIGASLVTKHVAPMMIAAGRGSIINLSSISGFVGQDNFATYNTTKFAIRGLTKCWAIDLAKYNIRVNSVCPGYIFTPAFENYCKINALDIQEESTRVGTLHLLGRQGRPAEIAAGVAFLASDDSSFMTGSDLVIDGGYLAR